METSSNSSGFIIRVARDARIVGGHNALLGEFPHQVAITYTDAFICGGSILGTMVVLTAAHCLMPSLYPYMSLFKVIAGLVNINDVGVGEQVRHVKSIQIHENFNLLTMANDIALMYLSEPFYYTNYVLNIELPRRNEHFINYATVTGWGKTAYNGSGSLYLKKVSVPIHSANFCRAKYLGMYNITSGMICMGGRGEDFCRGDSGGAAICRRSDSTIVQCGIVSFGRGCAQDFPGVYVLVTHYLDWIENSRSKHEFHITVYKSASADGESRRIRIGENECFSWNRSSPWNTKVKKFVLNGPCMRVWDDIDCGGRSTCFCQNESLDKRMISATETWADRITSFSFCDLRSHINAVVWLYEHRNFRGNSTKILIRWIDCVSFYAGDPWNDRTSSVKVTLGYVKFYTDANCKGDSPFPLKGEHAYIGDNYDKRISSVKAWP